jgi:hypothetical protein
MVEVAISAVEVTGTVTWTLTEGTVVVMVEVDVVTGVGA